MKKIVFSFAVLTLLLVLSAAPGAAKKNKNARQAAQMMRRNQAQRQRAMPASQTAPVANRKGNRKGRATNRSSNQNAPSSAAPARQILVGASGAPPFSQNRAAVAGAASKIDVLVLEKLGQAGQKPNLPAGDELFLRRVYLDAAGRIPTGDEATAFLSSNASDKRAQLIDALLLSEGYVSHNFNWLADMLRVKDKVAKSGPAYAYEEWLKERLVANGAWNQTVYQMMTAEGGLSTVGAAGYLLRDPAMPLDNLSNTLTTFLGANIACAQCHDHPSAPWTQRQFYEMAGFFGDVQTNLVKSNGLVKKVIRQSTKLDESDKKLLARLAAANNAQVQIVPGKKLTFPKDYQYDDAKPGDIVHPALFTWDESDKKNPAFAVDAKNPATRRTAFATWLTHPDNPRFAVTIANRVWQRHFGLGVQEPVTDMDDLNKASNPALLVHLGAEMKRLNFDLREFQRVLFNTQTYQRQSGVSPNLDKGPYLFPGPILRRLTAAQAWDSVLTLAVGSELDRYKLKRAEALQKLVINKPLTVKSLEEKALEMRGQNLKKSAGGYETEDGRTAAAPRFAGMVLARASELEQPGKESHFLRMFGQSDREIADDSSREGGIPQVLMMMNGDVQSVLAHKDALALKSAARLALPERQIESLYLSFLGRRPTVTEKTKVLQAFQQGMTLPELTWVLFNTREFIFVQ